MSSENREFPDEEQNIASLSLPIEVIIHILEHLSLSDLKSARQVSKTWYEASLDTHLIKKEILSISQDISSHNSVFAHLLKSNRIFLNLSLKEQDVSWKIPDFWCIFGPKLRSLSILNCDVRERDFVHILSYCKNLEHLKASGCRELLMSGSLLRDSSDREMLRTTLSNLKSLSINYNSYLSDALFNRFVKIADNINSLSLEGCQISFHLGLYKRFYPKDLVLVEQSKGNDGYEIMESSSILTFRNIINYVKSKSEQFISLCFAHTLIDSPALTQLAKVPNLYLRELSVSRCEQLTNAGVINIIEHQIKLQKLDLSFCSRITDPSLIAICRGLSGLKELSVRCCRAVTDIGVSEIKRLRNLISLDISQCDQVTSAGVNDALCCNINTTLRKLYLSRNNNITRDTVVRMSQNLPNLTLLDLGYCSTAVDDVSVQAIFKHQIWLRSLILNCCNKVTDAGLTGMGTGTYVSNLQESASYPDTSVIVLGEPARFKISLGSRAEEEIVRDAERKKAVLQMCEDCLSSPKPTGHSLANLKGLRELSLLGCSRVTDVSLCYAFEFLELQSLNLSLCAQVTQVGLGALAQNNPSIETLFLSRCFSVTDQAIKIISEKLHRLRNLDLSGCHELTNASLEYLGKNCKTLRYLDLNGCHHLQSHINESLLEHVSDLRLPPVGADQSDESPPQPPPLFFR